jgi:hypothetical protein
MVGRNNAAASNPRNIQSQAVTQNLQTDQMILKRFKIVLFLKYEAYHEQDALKLRSLG